MFQFFTAKVEKVVEFKVPVDVTDDADDDELQCIEKPVEPPKGKKEPVAIVELQLSNELPHDTKHAVVSTLVQGVPTRGKSSGQLLPFKDGVTAHLVFDLAFVRRLKPGTLLRVEWETRGGGIMGNVLAFARQQ